MMNIYMNACINTGMNIQSIALLASVLLLAGCALRIYTNKNNRTGGCGCCTGCSLRDACHKNKSI